MTRAKLKAHSESGKFNPNPEHRRLKVDEVQAELNEVRESLQRQIISLDRQVMNMRRELAEIQDTLANRGIGHEE